MRNLISIVICVGMPASIWALDGGTPSVNARNGWRALEIITVGDDPLGDGLNWAMPGTFDGLGAWLPESDTLRFQVNHEIGDATISDVDLNLQSFKAAIRSVIDTGNAGGVSFVESAGQAYRRWTNDGGATWTATTNPSNTDFIRFCSGQSYAPNTFGSDRGFVDEIYITGEEFGRDRLFAIDSTNRDFYQLSGVSGHAVGGIGGMPFDSWENAALIDTGENDHIALLLSPDGGSQTMKIYIGEKGKGFDGSPSTEFMARNGLAYGSYYYLNGSLPPAKNAATSGTFDTTSLGALASSKLEDVDGSPSQPNRVVLGVQTSGEYVFDFSLDFSSGGFNVATSDFLVTKIQNDDFGDGSFGSPDNVDWTDATTLNGIAYPEGIILTNEDTSTGEIWMSFPDGSGLSKIGDTIGLNGATESSGILDISSLLGYRPGSIIATSNQGSSASLTALINPYAVALPEPYGSGLLAWCFGLLARFRRRRTLET